MIALTSTVHPVAGRSRASLAIGLSTTKVVGSLQKRQIILFNLEIVIDNLVLGDLLWECWLVKDLLQDAVDILIC